MLVFIFAKIYLPVDYPPKLKVGICVFILLQEYENIENASPPSKAVHKKEKRKYHQGKDKPPTVSLKDFQSDSNIGMLFVPNISVN